MSELDNLIKQVEALAAGAPKPEALCWLHNGKTGEDWFADYCWDCAEKIKAWLCGGPEPDHLRDPMKSHPDWENYTEEDIDIDGGYLGYEDDGIRFCELCGCMLDIALTDYGINEELHNFEESEGELSVGAWREWLMVLESIDGGYSESDQLYQDAIRITQELLTCTRAHTSV
jgi:hypothetical protein